MSDDTSTPVLGVCPNGHGDEQGIIAAEVSYAAHPHPNCPICGSRLKYTDACEEDYPWCVGPEGPDVDGAAWDGKCSTCALATTEAEAEAEAEVDR